jgi:hypothetical protein
MDSSLSVDSESIIPSELLGQLPRRTRLSGDGIWGVIALTIILAFPAFIACMAFNTWFQVNQTRDALRRESSEVAGVVTQIKYGKVDRVYYTFVVDGRSYTGHSTMPRKIGNNLRDSDPLSIRYLPSNPSVNHPAEWEDSESIWLGIIFLTFLSAMVFMVLKNFRNDRLLVANGMPAVALITKSSSTRGGYLVKYDFRTADGMVIKGSGGYDFRPEIGARICVLYLPQNPKRNQTYPSRYYCVVQ